MSRFPDAVITAMHHAGTTVTCMPVQLDQGEWVAAVFFVLPEQYDESSGKALFRRGLIPIALEADIREAATATLISLGIELRPPVHEVLSGEVLFIPGHMESHHEAVRLLSHQQELTVFVGDKHCTLLHQQKIPLASAHRSVFADLLREAASRDALIRFRGQYDPDAAFVEITRPH